MNNFASTILDRFMNFITRALVPQSVFFITFMIFDLIFSDFNKSIFLIKYFLNHWQSSLVFILIVGAGWAFIVSFVYQIFDSFNSKNYTKLFDFNSKECFKLKSLRDSVIKSLKEKNYLPVDNNCNLDNIYDYQLYEILANKYLFNNLGSVTQFNDKASHVYSIVLSFIINFALFIFIFDNNLPLNEKIIYLILCIFFSSIIAIYNARKYYRKRNIRLYINYLLIYDNKYKEEEHDKQS